MELSHINKIRNFSIIAHIDHGKSTLADRIMELTHAVSQRDMKEQLLDNMELERERGITIKLQTVHMEYLAENGSTYEFNLIDTPGHADFNYEVSRSLAACEGALLLIDATQGVQAQTLANLQLANQLGLSIIPVINKIDMPNAEVEKVLEELKSLPHVEESKALLISAKTGQGVHEVLESIIRNIPAPQQPSSPAPKALVFDSHYDPYTGVSLNVRVISGSLQPGMKMYLLKGGQVFQAESIGVYTPQQKVLPCLDAGEVGFVATGLKDPSSIKVGDTLACSPDTEPLQGFQEVQSLVFAGLFPVDNRDELKLRDAVEKLALNDSAFQFHPEVSLSLGKGFRCGFLGILHMEIIQERLEREFGLEIISTAPSVEYHILQKDGTRTIAHSPAEFPFFGLIDSIEEPFASASLILPVDALGDIMALCRDKRGEYQSMEYLNETTVQLHYNLPLSEIVYDFYDSLKTLSHGYATVQYHPAAYQAADLVKMDIWLNDDPVDAFSSIVPREKAPVLGREMVEKLKYLIPRKLYPMPVQAVVENKPIAREDIPPIRKTATGKGFSGRISRKKRAAKKITENKNRQRKVGKADVPQEAFHAILTISR